MQLDIAAWGWDDPCWDTLYPADLPDDWRLDYYANEFHALLLPVSLWTAQSDATLGHWFSEAHPRFHFYLELNDPQQAVRLLRLLEETGFPASLSGWLWSAALLQDKALRQLGEQLPGASWLPQPPAPGTQIPGLNLCWREGQEVRTTGESMIVVPIDNFPDLRAIQQLIRDRQAMECRHLLLPILPHPDAPQILRQLHTLGILLNG